MKLKSWFSTLAFLFFVSLNAYTQGRGGGRGAVPQPPANPQAAAPIDITGYWVSLVTEDWRYRMATPPKGDFLGVPLNQAGRDAANAWDPAKEEAAGEHCKAYGVGGIMRLPTRLHITWQDNSTLKVETDAGTQTRILSFLPSQRQGGDWQGVSIASWDRQATVMGSGRGGPPPGGSLKVVTSNHVPGDALLDQYALQETKRFGWLESDAVFRQIVGRKH
jgi:hypothetical protein